MMVLQGVLYKLGDFQMRVIKVVPSQAESLRGIMIEVCQLGIVVADNNTCLLLVLGVFMVIQCYQ